MAQVPSVPFFTLAPDWVCEVTSSSTRAIDRVRKMPVYAREKVGHVWLLDPVERLLEVFQLQGERWLSIAAYEGNNAVRAAPFEAVELDLGRFWLDGD